PLGLRRRSLHAPRGGGPGERAIPQTGAAEARSERYRRPSPGRARRDVEVGNRGNLGRLVTGAARLALRACITHRTRWTSIPNPLSALRLCGLSRSTSRALGEPSRRPPRTALRTPRAPCAA